MTDNSKESAPTDVQPTPKVWSTTEISSNPVLKDYVWIWRADHERALALKEAERAGIVERCIEVAIKYVPSYTRETLAEAIRSLAPAESKGEAVHANRDWPEDFTGENGNYLLKCLQCGNDFRGYKRRCYCKVCASPQAAGEDAALKTFIREIFALADWPEGGDIDGFDFQEAAIRAGLLTAETRNEPCGENCHCAEYHGDMSDGVTCYRKVQWLFDAERRRDAT